MLHKYFVESSDSQCISKKMLRYIVLPLAAKCRSNHLTKKQPIVVKTNHSKDLYQINLTSLG